MTSARGAERELESDIQAKIRLALGCFPGEVLLLRNNIGGRGRVRFGVGGRGGADVVGVYKSRDGVGVALFAEIKTSSGRQTKEQRAHELLVRGYGAEYALLRSVADASAWLAELRRKYGVAS